MEIRMHNIARGIVVKEGKLLVANFKGHHSFLPGGHIELGESAEKAILRELREEAGVEGEIERFLGVIEHRYEEKEVLHHTINHLFTVKSDELISGQVPERVPS